MRLTAIVLGIASFSLVLVAIADKATLSLPTPVNCGDRAEMICTSTNCIKNGYSFMKGGLTIYTLKGPHQGIDSARYSANVTSDTQVHLTITNIQLSDVGNYSCTCGFDTDSARHTLQYQCKATTCSTEISPAKKLNVTVDKLYPEPSGPSGIVTYLTSRLPGMYTCVSSLTFDFHYRCTWVSIASLPDGNHSYNITVTTGTQSALVVGSFKIVTATSPTISNLVPISDNRQVINGVQDIPLTIQCVSRGGIPAPTLAWHRNSVSTSALTPSSTNSVQQDDGTYRVTLTHSFTPSRTDYMTAFLCRVSYPGATTEASPDPSYASALLYLVWPPAAPTVRDILTVTPGQVILTVVPGFHGGYNQTLVVQISSDLTTWINKTSVYIGLDNRPTEVKLSNLKRNALYHVQIFAYNSAGRQICCLEILNFTTAAIPGDIPISPSNTATVAGSVVGVIVFLALIGLVIFLSRKYDCSLKEKLNESNPSDNVPKTNSRNIYESAVAARDSAHVYSELDRPVVVPGGQNRLNNPALYESTTVLASPEHVYTSLSATPKGGDVPMAESRNIYESAVAARDSAHDYSELDRPVVVPGAQNRLNNPALYESTTVLASPEHVYTSLSPAPKENVSERLMENY